MWRYALLLLTSLILTRCSHKEDFQIGKEWLLDSGYGLQPEARQQLKNALLKNGDENLSILIKPRLQVIETVFNMRYFTIISSFSFFPNLIN